VPEVLTSGNHGAIARWRRDQALARTAAHRPDLLAALDPAGLDKKDRALLESLDRGPETD
jgi:tRNA (guanine37-N1)-methyltransferase